VKGGSGTLQQFNSLCLVMTEVDSYGMMRMGCRYLFMLILNLSQTWTWSVIHFACSSLMNFLQLTRTFSSSTLSDEMEGMKLR
jgi:hypothetical protein